jgi:hypothetical protein
MQQAIAIRELQDEVRELSNLKEALRTGYMAPR